MAKCIFENLTPEQAKILALWFEGAGEQDCVDWFENKGVRAPITDVGRKGGWKSINGDDVTIYCRGVESD